MFRSECGISAAILNSVARRLVESIARPSFNKAEKRGTVGIFRNDIICAKEILLFCSWKYNVRLKLEYLSLCVLIIKVTLDH